MLETKVTLLRNQIERWPVTVFSQTRSAAVTVEVTYARDVPISRDGRKKDARGKGAVVEKPN